MKLIVTGKPTGAVLAMLAGIAAAYFGFLRRWHMTWGATRSGWPSATRW